MLYPLTIFLSAFLLFQIQLVIAKDLLPWFGGTPAVWTTCQVFFQAMLLVGYAYAHALGREPRPRQQGRSHLIMLGCALVPIVALAWRNGTPLLPNHVTAAEVSEHPVGVLLLILGGTVGLPFFVLAATSPLLQRWHSWSAGGPLDRTYRLYALSNAGSLLGLVSYPFAVEWLLDLDQQAWLWSGLFILFVLGCGAIAWRISRQPRPAPAADPAPAEAASSASGPGMEPDPSPAGRAALWILLPFTSSAAFLACTNQLVQDVASVPFFWILPLALYLLTFIICFDRPRWYARAPAVTLAAAASGWVLHVAEHSLETGLGWQVAAFAVFVFLLCFVCHGELARLRPGAAHLTLYYLTIALGGVLGGVFVSLLAPTFFPDVWEFHLTVVIGWVVIATALARDRYSAFHYGDVAQFACFGAGLLFIVSLLLLRRTPLGAALQGPEARGWIAFAIAVNGGIALWLLGWRNAVGRWRWWPRFFVGSMIALSLFHLERRIRGTDREYTVTARNFFGVSRIEFYISAENLLMAQLLHGNINHGVQVLDESWQREPTTYYVRSSGVGLAARFAERRTDPATAGASFHLGVIGLGTGTMAAYGRPGDLVRFYEINPLVISFSEDPDPVFTYVHDSAADVAIVLGDARLSLEDELARGERQDFDLLVLDAFSSDAIPVHLLTSEAFDVYVRHLRDDRSIIAVHISNRFLDLEPVVAAQARRLGMTARLIQSDGEEPLKFMSSWILLVRDPTFFDDPHVVEAEPVPLLSREVMFTDRYSNLFRILK